MCVFVLVLQRMTGGMQWYVDKLVCEGCDVEKFYTGGCQLWL